MVVSDLHVHLLPGLDDGPSDEDQAIALAAKLAGDGVRRVATTPHLRFDYPGVRPDELAARTGALQERIDRERIDLDLVTAGEVAIEWAMAASDEDLRLVSYGQRGQDVLIETPYGPLPAIFEELLFRVAARGYRILLAHPERNHTLQNDPERLGRMVEQGVLVQITASALRLQRAALALAAPGPRPPARRPRARHRQRLPRGDPTRSAERGRGSRQRARAEPCAVDGHRGATRDRHGRATARGTRRRTAQAARVPRPLATLTRAKLTAWRPNRPSPSPAGPRCLTSSPSTSCARPPTAPSAPTQAGTFAYGTAVGYRPLREWIAAKHGVAPEQVMVTNGSMQADAFLFDELVHEGAGVVVERPTYDRTLLSLRQRGADITAIELEDDGIDVDALEAALRGGRAPKLAHVIPNFQNPAGHTLSLDKRRKLLALAREHDFVIFEDDPYVDIRFRGESLPRMLELDEDGGNVVYACSFSKTVCPGIRVGYLVGQADLIGRIVKRATNTYISPSMVSQSIVNEFCRSGAIETSIATVREALRERADALAAALERELPDARFVAPDGGYFLWVDLPEAIDVDELHVAAAERGVQFVKGSDFMLDGGEHSLRLAYSGVTVEQIEEGVRRLAAATGALV